MKHCYLCKRLIPWPKERIRLCNKHYFHTLCAMKIERCYDCAKEQEDVFLRQRTPAGARSSHRDYFDNEKLLRKVVNNTVLFKYLLTKVDVHKILLLCIANNDINFFSKIVKNTSLNLFATKNGKTIWSELEGKGGVFKNVMLQKIRVQTTRPPPPPPPRPSPSAPPPEDLPPPYEEVMKWLKTS